MAEPLTLTDLEALPLGSVVEDRAGDEYIRLAAPQHATDEDWAGYSERVLDSTWPSESLLLWAPVTLRREGWGRPGTGKRKAEAAR